ncbi:diheme cytochrome c [Pseudomonas sp. MAP12]|uniref:Diheme cytochrome c n=1 Tax=Geopseudomonas aromaticivorans TaxID=2849492 RepID=A0ABS6N233_9GAMM|nr:diheme cytochrome c [Pseudomonas aromaticivorans]MBV2134865.1 diheme cytochrome c [Pseudomonas aromaticivorans]
MQRKGLALALVAMLAGAGILFVQAASHETHEHHRHHESHRSHPARDSAAAQDAQPAQPVQAQYKRPKQLAVPADAPQAWLNECGSCHMAYPPGLLPPKAWEQHMNTLSHHYGSDASLDPAEEQQIRDFLLLVSSNNRLPVEGVVSADAQPRITESRWFKRRHDEVSAAKFARESVGGAGNCVACHRNAERGSFGKVKIPR